MAPCAQGENGAPGGQSRAFPLTSTPTAVISTDMQQAPLTTHCPSCSESGPCYDKFKEILKLSGGRLTDERVAILKEICSSEGHFTPEELVEKLKRSGQAVALTTVYRNLDPLLEAGILRQTDISEAGRAQGARYEHIWGHTHHDHLVCSGCGLRVEFSYPAIDALQEVVAKSHGFVLERHTLELIGRCAACQKQAARPDAK